MTNHHWTDDAGLLERYVLGRVGDRERAELEEHLDACERCRSAVRMEQEVAAGARRLGRDELKEKLRQRIGRREAPAVLWPRFAAAAAVIVIIVGVGIYSDWFGFYAEPPMTIAEGDEGPVEPQLRREQESGGRSAMSEQAQPGPAGAQRPVAAERDAGAKQSKAERGRRQDVRADEELVVQSEAPGARHEPPVDITVSRRASQSEIVWVDGVVIPRAGLYNDQAQAVYQTAKKGVTKDSEEKGILVQQAQQRQTIVFNQKSAGELPASQKAKKQTVRTLVEKKDSELWLTLYPETPFDENELRNAVVDPIGMDSIVVRIGDQHIGYRIPGGLARPMPAKEE